MLEVIIHKISSFQEALSSSNSMNIFIVSESDYSKNWLEKYFSGQELEIISKTLDAHQFKAEAGSQCSVFQEGKTFLTSFIGTNSSESTIADRLESLRKSISSSIKIAKKYKAGQICIFLPENLEIFGKSAQELCYDCLVTARLTEYEPDSFKSKRTNTSIGLNLAISTNENFDFSKTISNANIVGDSLNLARSLCDTPPNICSPQYFCEKILQSCKDIPSLKTRIIEPAEARELGLNAFLAVGGGSVNQPRFMIIEYSSIGANKDPIALVGKGVTFDTGGVNLKPGDAMAGMKYDMSGAAVCAATIIAAARMSLPVNLVCVTPLVENMPSGTAYRQEDVIVPFAKNPTIEIGNTDAEGRVILADGLAWAAQHYNPKIIIDVATLTGACIVALGPVYAALLSNNDELANDLLKSGQNSGDWLWRLPMHKLYKKSIESKIADISNSGQKGFGAGTITAAEFLRHFVPDSVAWAHLDIAGVDTCAAHNEYGTNCSSGFGIRLLVEFLKEKSVA